MQAQIADAMKEYLTARAAANSKAAPLQPTPVPTATKTAAPVAVSLLLQPVATSGSAIRHGLSDRKIPAPYRQESLRQSAIQRVVEQRIPPHPR